jgi:Uma2 family endonuclease
MSTRSPVMPRTIPTSAEAFGVADRARPRLRVTAETFDRLCVENPELRLERNADGELIVMAPAALDSSFRNAGLTAQLWSWNARTGLGKVFDSSAGVTLPNTAIRGPDAMWITNERWEAVPQEERQRFARLTPDFVAELRSKSDGRGELREKMREYMANGVRLAWLIDPIAGEVEIHRAGRPVEVLKQPVTLSGEDVLPGFVLDLKGILSE